jgi:hypothetical protein
MELHHQPLHPHKLVDHVLHGQGVDGWLLDPQDP